MENKLEVRKYKITSSGQYDVFLEEYRNNLVEETEVLEKLSNHEEGVQIFTSIFNIDKNTVILRYKWTEGTTLSIGGINKKNLNETIKRIKSKIYNLEELAGKIK